MNIDDELLIAFADGECSEIERARVERALADDPELRERLEQHRRVAARLSARFGPVAEAPVPDRLTALLQKREADVVDFAAARAKREQRRTSPGWGRWGAIAASLAVGVMAGQLALPGRGGLVESRGGTLVAQGDLAEALDVQLASTPEAGSAVRVGLSFRDRSGQYCRSFEAGGLAGIGCRSADGWVLPVTHAAKPGMDSVYRQAGAGDALVMQAATAMMQGEPLDAATERKVRDKGWR